MVDNRNDTSHSAIMRIY